MFMYRLILYNNSYEDFFSEIDEEFKEILTNEFEKLKEDFDELKYVDIEKEFIKIEALEENEEWENDCIGMVAYVKFE